MNKEKFLQELREYLQVLEDQEQEDILEEYAQHIDMKLQKGLSEEEAIRDFGSMKELAAEILEAYHVKPGFRQRNMPVPFRMRKKEQAEDGGNFFRSAADFWKGKILAAARGGKKAFQWFGRKCRGLADWAAGLFRGENARRQKTESGKPEGQIAAGTEKENLPLAAGRNGRNGKENEKGTMAGDMGKLLRGIGQGIGKLWRCFLSLCNWGLKTVWNAGWLMLSLFCAFWAMVALAGFGALTVLLFQGYPLAGMLIISFGGILCFGALTCWAFSMIIRKSGKISQSEREVQYE